MDFDQIRHRDLSHPRDWYKLCSYAMGVVGGREMGVGGYDNLILGTVGWILTKFGS